MGFLQELKIPNEKIKVGNFVAGEWGESSQKIDVRSPITGEIIGEVSCADKALLDRAVQSAKEAQKDWANTPLKERTRVMFNFRQILLDRMDEIANIISLENGKTLGESKAGIMKGVEVLEYAISLQNKDMGGKMEVSRGVWCEYRREALGVVSNITPFNFPAMVPMWTIPIVLTLGNAYIWKPSEKTPLTSKWIVDALVDSGLPKALFQVLHGGKEIVDEILEHKDIKAIGFVGSTKVAEQIYKKGSAAGKRVLALGGAKNHIILLPDADPNMCGVGIADSFTGCAGQRCMAASVLLAVGDVNLQIEKIVERARSTRAGIEMGAVITKEQYDFLCNAIDRAEKEGAKILLDGRKAEKPEEFKNGFWLGPTILDEVKVGTEAANVELFGPVISIIRCKNISEALEIENSNEYGNAASVFTNNGALAEKVAREAKAGMVGINIGVPVPREPFSFGGINQSKFGHGDITGANSLNFWTDIKKVTTKWEMQNDHNWMS